MKRHLRREEEWGALKCVDVGWVYPSAGQYNGYKTRPHIQYDLECKCGEKFSILQINFPGKRAMMDCGKCQTAWGITTGPVTVYMQSDVMELVAEYARKGTHMSKSQAFMSLIRLGWEKYMEQVAEESSR